MPKLLHHRPVNARGSVGSSTKALANSEDHVVFGMSVRVAKEHIPCQNASREEENRVTLEKEKTPVKVEKMAPYLSRYPNREAARTLWLGFEEGFPIPSELADVPPVSANLRSAYDYSDVVSSKLQKEVPLDRMVGPFAVPQVGDLVVSPLGVVPKKEPNQFWLIHHLSQPKGGSVIDTIDPALCSVSYASFDEAVRWVQRFGRGALMAKTGIESAFRLLLVHPDCVRLLGCSWEGEYFVDRCLPMGCAISCSYFELFSSFLEWVVKDLSGLRSILHYLDGLEVVRAGLVGVVRAGE